MTNIPRQEGPFDCRTMEVIAADGVQEHWRPNGGRIDVVPGRRPIKSTSEVGSNGMPEVVGPLEEASFPGRTFQMQLFVDGHRQLLLRSGRSNSDGTQHSTRLSILFKDVRSVDLPTTLRGPSITSSLLDGLGGRRYSVEGLDFSGVIVAESMFTEEDFERDRLAPGQLLSEVEVRFAPIPTTELREEEHRVAVKGMALVVSPEHAARLAEDLDLAVRLSAREANASASGRLATEPHGYLIDVWWPIQTGRGPIHSAPRTSRLLDLSGPEVVLLRAVREQLFEQHAPSREAPRWKALSGKDLNTVKRLRDELLTPRA